MNDKSTSAALALVIGERSFSDAYRRARDDASSIKSLEGRRAYVLGFLFGVLSEISPQRSPTRFKLLGTIARDIEDSEGEP